MIAGVYRTTKGDVIQVTGPNTLEHGTRPLAEKYGTELIEREGLDHHTTMSLIKSGIRIAGALALFFSGIPFTMVAGACLGLAEVFGIVEEF